MFTSTDAERQSQIIEARRLASQDHTLHVSRPRSERPRNDGPKKAPATGHEAFLKALVATSATVVVRLLSDGQLLKGTIKHTDKYTLTLTIVGDDGVTVVDMVIFKHAIESFWSLTPKAAA